MVRRAAALGLLAAALSACPERASAPANLTVPLPDGWKATASPRGLVAGPGAHTVLELEAADRPLPSADALAAAVAGQGGVVLRKSKLDEFVGVVYASEDAGVPVGFLGARRAGARTVWCASTAGASPAELSHAWDVCAGVRWE